MQKERSSSVLKARSFRTADCGTDHYLAVAKVRETLAMSKRITHMFHMVWFEQYCVRISNRFATLKHLDAEVDITNAWKTMRENIKISAEESLG
jgi:L-ribulose-5-phosphate 3-epimerase UlaE